MTLEITHSELSLLIDSLTTRLSRVDDMIAYWDKREQRETAQYYSEEGQRLIALREQLIDKKYKYWENL
jgi:hypothetical protein